MMTTGMNDMTVDAVAKDKNVKERTLRFVGVMLPTGLGLSLSLPSQISCASSILMAEYEAELRLE